MLYSFDSGLDAEAALGNLRAFADVNITVVVSPFRGGYIFEVCVYLFSVDIPVHS